MAEPPLHARPTTFPPRQQFSNVPLTTQKQSDHDDIFLSLSDHNAWYYPSRGFDSEETPISISGGNWDQKMAHDSRWARKGKAANWGSSKVEWEADERARKRLMSLLPAPRPPSPLTLPHLRSPSPSCDAPYELPNTRHTSFSSFVMDKSVTRSFRSTLFDELDQATTSFIEGEVSVRQALNRLWQVLSEDPDAKSKEPPLLPKREEEVGEEEEDSESRLARAPDLTPIIRKLFLVSYPDSGPPVLEPSHFASLEMQQISLEKSLATLLELQDDEREYIERLEEIQDGLGNARAQRDSIWDVVRQKAVKELHDVACGVTTDLH
ncbi:hypothetical protein SERLA73DRAFT_183569 [Serpula lacrymans var. lacrymans S7.3]|uniref:Uncharacterized protein n=2 Tax=Serpula lacrymans var. lacrymans TaxID=341189 RepID=F8Q047_SERL3|nr:uncharacterized protein SERLADRAFT_470816 [Serpula lacrymans var. lacrymans S7.9]EGN98519.1 hypothetical protein SERLA73DRAFT_183569 [Serpula lacrymans var. lacrymans S7.3]EGO24089.1 hypothetical protein SERLADRAFT_470816 [Serpula lacrymans var. lacrymans S7.9]